MKAQKILTAIVVAMFSLTIVTQKLGAQTNASARIYQQMTQTERAQFVASQAREPNRFRNYLGAATAADAAGDKAAAAKYYKQLVALAAKGDGSRPEIARAKAVVAAK